VQVFVGAAHGREPMFIRSCHRGATYVCVSVL